MLGQLVIWHRCLTCWNEIILYYIFLTRLVPHPPHCENNVSKANRASGAENRITGGITQAQMFIEIKHVTGSIDQEFTTLAPCLPTRYDFPNCTHLLCLSYSNLCTFIFSSFVTCLFEEKSLACGCCFFFFFFFKWCAYHARMVGNTVRQRLHHHQVFHCTY